MSYLLDTNTLITAKNDFYAFDVFPCFWSWLEHETLSGTCVLLDVVVDEKFLSVADPWLIAAGKVWGDTVVTFEKHPGVGAKRVKIPAIAQRMNVRVMNLYQMMRELHANFE